MSSLVAQNAYGDTSSLPIPKEPFNLTYWDVREHIHNEYPEGKIVATFYIDTNGKVENPEIIDTFNINLNEVVIDKLLSSKYQPAMQNGIPVKVKYTLPIVFK